MFRLDRQSLTTPCDLCKHNHTKRIYGAILDNYIIRCTQLEPLSALNATGMPVTLGHKPYEIYSNEEEDGTEKTYVICPKFELSVDRLEDVVYNKRTFMWQIGYVGLIDMEGNIETAFDPFQIAINTARAKMILATDGRRVNKALRKLYNELQVIYPKIRAKEDDFVQLAEALAAHVCTDVIVYDIPSKIHIFNFEAVQFDTNYKIKSARDWVESTVGLKCDCSPISHNEKTVSEVVEKTIECIKHYNVDFYNLIT